MKIIFRLLGFLLIVGSVFAQMQSYKKGLGYFERGEFDLCVRELQKVKNISPEEQARLNYTIAEAYRQSNRWVEAVPFYEKAITAKTNEPNALFHYAFALKAVAKYADALRVLEQYIASKPSNKVFLEKALRESNTLKIIDELRKKNQEIELTNLKINTKGAEFSPMVLNDELIFTASRKDKSFSDGLPFVGLYKARLGTSLKDLGTPQLFSNTIFADDRNEGTPTFSPDGRTLIFARGNSGKRKDLSPDVDLYLSRFDGSIWTEPRLVSASDSIAWDGTPAFSRDGKTLYFASNRLGGSGGLDLWRVNMDASGRFGNPANMGKDINTAGDEMFPYVSEDGKLYFASDGHAGLGKLDLFMAVRVGGKTTVENMGLPYNSVADDFGLSMDKKGNIFLASNREGGQGNDDVYAYELPVKNKIAENIKPLDPEKIRLDSLAKLAEIKRVNYFLAGNILTNDENNNIIPLDSAKVSISDESNGNSVAEFTSNEKGIFGRIALEEGKDYTILVEKNGYLIKRETFSMAGRAIPIILLKKAITDTTFLTSIQLDKVILGKVFRLENIYYDLNKADIRADAAIELDKLVQVLKDNPNIKIELSSHTDSRSSDIYNLRLSQQRAESAVNYILSKGIDTDRLVARGYGESMLIMSNAKTESEHQINRRTEFKVTEIVGEEETSN